MGISVEVANLELDDVLKRLSDGSHELVLRKRKKKKSLTANAYMWVLCDEIAKVLHTTKDSVYKQAILNVGVYVPMACVEQAWKRTKIVWETRGLGYFCQETDRKNGWVAFNAYIGTSAYSSAELSRVINELVNEAESVGINTLASRELKKLILKWREEYGKTKGTTDPTFSGGV